MAAIQQKNLFVGYSTLDNDSNKHQQFADIALIKRDLINNFYTRPGERLMLPTYGCGIWQLLFEPYDQVTHDSIVHEATQIISNDSRLSLNNINVIQIDQGILLQIELLYIPFSVIDTFTLTFNQTSIK